MNKTNKKRYSFLRDDLRRDVLIIDRTFQQLVRRYLKKTTS